MRHTASVPGHFAFLIILPCRRDTRNILPNLDDQATRNHRTKSHVMQVIVLLTAQPKVIAETRLTRIECRYTTSMRQVVYPRESIKSATSRSPCQDMCDILYCIVYRVFHPAFAVRGRIVVEATFQVPTDALRSKRKK